MESDEILIALSLQRQTLLDSRGELHGMWRSAINFTTRPIKTAIDTIRKNASQVLFFATKPRNHLFVTEPPTWH